MQSPAPGVLDLSGEAEAARPIPCLVVFDVADRLITAGLAQQIHSGRL
jgi:hypothetical protein